MDKLSGGQQGAGQAGQSAGKEDYGDKGMFG